MVEHPSSYQFALFSYKKHLSLVQMASLMLLLVVPVLQTLESSVVKHCVQMKTTFHPHPQTTDYQHVVSPMIAICSDVHILLSAI